MHTNQTNMQNEPTSTYARAIREAIAKLDNTIVYYPAMKNAIDGLNECISWSEFNKEPVGAVLVGTGGMGKTTICNLIVKNFPPQIVENNLANVLTIPAFYSSIPSPSTIKSLAVNLLESLGDPFPKKGSANVLTTRLYTLLKQCQTKIILLDEFHHLLLEGSATEKRTHKICNWLKSLINNTGVMVCLIGTPSCEALVNFDSQMSRRFMHRYRLNLLDAGTTIKPGPLGGFLRALSKKYVKHLMLDGMPDFNNHHHVEQMLAATSGNPSFVVALMKKATANAMIASRNIVVIEDFADAFDTEISAPVAEFEENPFRMTERQLALKLGYKALKGKKSC
ncbi:TniB family NTP-binding protein [Herminiimonas sp. NPDC097707]|uniref:TniB family NTP-binding protein n=1 Tax=Herminiimonas sp. NPDC097707 TaxID=3364007 RepID=UPI00383BEF32